jgi:hypothetical protein
MDYIKLRRIYIKVELNPYRVELYIQVFFVNLIYYEETLNKVV